VTPVFAGESLAAIISLHQLGAPRHWTEAEIEACREAARRVAELL
jgi:GAF domain-containing protein